MAVYTDVADDELRDFVAQYDIGNVVSCKGIPEGIENSNYMLHTSRGDFILTLYEKRVRSQDLPYFLGLMDHLSASGIACPTPIYGHDGTALRRLSGRPAAIVTYLKGMCPRRIHPRHCSDVGRALAHMHIAGRSFPMTRTNDLSIAGWRHLFEDVASRAHEVQSGLKEELEKELTWLEREWPNTLPAGVIHADLFPDNVFFLDQTFSGLIDFYFSCNDFFAYDIAICLNAWCFEADVSFNITKAQSMLRAYRKARPFSEQELLALPILARGSSMRFLLTRLYDLFNHPQGALVKPKDPLEYLTRLRFHRQVTKPSAYGLD